MNAPGNLEHFVATFNRSWPSCRALVRDLPAEVIDVGDRWSAVGPALSQRLTVSTTLCHGDFRLDNLRFDDDGVIAFDWQLPTVAHGVTDLADFASRSVQTDARAGRDRELLRRYLRSIDADEAWDIYRHAVLAMLSFPVTLHAAYEETTDAGRSTIAAMLQRSIAAISELACWDVDAARGGRPL